MLFVQWYQSEAPVVACTMLRWSYTEHLTQKDLQVKSKGSISSEKIPQEIYYIDIFLTVKRIIWCCHFRSNPGLSGSQQYKKWMSAIVDYLWQGPINQSTRRRQKLLRRTLKEGWYNLISLYLLQNWHMHIATLPALSSIL